jgi:hypothetical protein
VDWLGRVMKEWFAVRMKLNKLQVIGIGTVASRMAGGIRSGVHPLPKPSSICCKEIYHAKASPWTNDGPTAERDRFDRMALAAATPTS